MENHFKHCPACASPLIFKEERLMECSQCGFHFYINPAPCNGVIVENESRQILLVKRRYEPKKGYYDLPGGFIGYNESVEESAAREIEEELGTPVTNLTYFRSFHDLYTYKNVTYHTLGMVFTGTIDSKKAKPLDDITDIEYFKYEDIPYHKIAFESVKKAIKEYISNK